jgi:acetyl esterase/lipase
MAMRILILSLGVTAMVATGALAQVRDRAREEGGLRERLTERRMGQTMGTARADAVLVYGAADKQRVDLYRPASGGKGQPLILYVHGGGWAMGSHKQVSEKPAWASRMGLWFGSIGYRYLPEAPVETQAADVGAAIRKARAEAGKHGYDANRIILMGHSAGAHLAALVASDPQYAGDAFSAIKAVIPIDGAGYDVPVQMRSGRGPLMRLYVNAFGDDPARQRLLSPVTHAGRGDAPRWLIIHVADRAASAHQATLLAAPLRAGGVNVTIKPIPGTHMTANRDFGTVDYPAQAEVDALLKAVVG